MKKLISVLLSLVMVLSVSFTTVFAADDLQGQLDALTTPNDYTITLTGDFSGDITVVQKEGINITLDGAGYTFDGTIYIEGQSRNNGAETLTIKNINFATSKASLDFISCNSTESAKRYAHNVTVQNCTFNATAEGNSVVAMRFRQCYNINVVNVETTGLHSMMWATGTTGLTITDASADDQNGVSVGTSKNVTIENTIITADTYGVRADGSSVADVTVTDSTITAAMPVVLRYATAEDYELNVVDCELADTDGGAPIVLTTGKDDEEITAPTVDITVDYSGTMATYPTGNDDNDDNDEIVAVEKEEDPEYASVTAKILWNGKATDSVDVKLLKNEKKSDTATLKAGKYRTNNWCYTWKELDLNEDWDIEVVVPAGYECEIDEVDEYYFEITLTQIEEIVEVEELNPNTGAC